MAEEEFDLNTARKEDLQDKARELGVDDSGTVQDLRGRIREAEESAGSGEPVPGTGGGNVVRATDPAEVLREKQDEANKASDETYGGDEGDEEAGQRNATSQVGTRNAGPRSEGTPERNPLAFATAPDGDEGAHYIGVDAIYQNHSDHLSAPLLGEEGSPDRAVEDRIIAGNELVNSQSARAGVLGHRGAEVNLGAREAEAAKDEDEDEG